MKGTKIIQLNKWKKNLKMKKIRYSIGKDYAGGYNIDFPQKY